jgi:hypothetical protein
MALVAQIEKGVIETLPLSIQMYLIMLLVQVDLQKNIQIANASR